MYNIDTTNTVESLNGILTEAMKYWLLPMIDVILANLTEWFNKYRKLSSELPQNQTLVPKVHKFIHKIISTAKTLKVHELNNFYLEYSVVGHDGKNYAVDLINSSCSCRSFDIDRYPCLHGVTDIIRYSESIEITEEERDIMMAGYCSKYYWIEQWALAYTRTVYPVPHHSFWDVPYEIRAQTVHLLLPPTPTVSPADPPPPLLLRRSTTVQAHLLSSSLLGPQIIASAKEKMASGKEKMASTSDDTTYVWSDEETRLYLQLRIEEQEKGNSEKAGINDTGKQNILNKFNEVYGSKHTWGKFRNKYYTCKRQYGYFRSLTHRTGLGYDSNGFIDMSDDWWEEQFKEWPAARKIKEKEYANMDLMEKLYGSGDESWSAQQGEYQLDYMMLEEHINESDAGSESLDDVPRVSKKRRTTHDIAAAIRDSSQSRDEILSQKNQLLEHHPDYSCSQIHAMRVLHSLSGVRMWSPLYKAAILHLQANSTNRQTFLAYEEDENKVLYLEFATGESKDK